MKKYISKSLSQLNQSSKPDEWHDLGIWRDKTSEWEVVISARVRRHMNSPVVSGYNPSSALRRVSFREDFINAVLRKYDKYKKIDYPLVVAVNSTVDHVSTGDVIAALFGEEAFLVGEGASSVEPFRKKNGLLWDARGERRKQLSALLISSRLSPIGMRNPEKTPWLWHIPWAKKPLASSMWSGRQMDLFPPPGKDKTLIQYREVPGDSFVNLNIFG